MKEITLLIEEIIFDLKNFLLNKGFNQKNEKIIALYIFFCSILAKFIADNINRSLPRFSMTNLFRYIFSNFIIVIFYVLYIVFFSKLLSKDGDKKNLFFSILSSYSVFCLLLPIAIILLFFNFEQVYPFFNIFISLSLLNRVINLTKDIYKLSSFQISLIYSLPILLNLIIVIILIKNM